MHRTFLLNFSKITQIGIHPGQCALINILDKNDGRTQREIAECMHIKPPTVAVSVKRLEKIGLVEKKNDEFDMRKTRIYITEKGKELAKEIQEINVKIKEQLFNDFTEDELCMLEKLYKHMLENLEKAGNEEKLKKSESICSDEI